MILILAMAQDGLFLNIFRGSNVLAGECLQGGLEESGLIVNIAIGWLHIAV